MLEPLVVAHAREMVEVLTAPTLYAVIGGTPPTEAELVARYARQVGGPAREDEAWLNWILREGDRPVGTVQATVTSPDEPDPAVAALAWVVRAEEQGRGLATDAARAVAAHLETHGVRRSAWIADRNAASVRVATRLCLRRTDEQRDGERLWASEPDVSRGGRSGDGEPAAPVS